MSPLITTFLNLLALATLDFISNAHSYTCVAVKATVERRCGRTHRDKNIRKS